MSLNYLQYISTNFLISNFADIADESSKAFDMYRAGLILEFILDAIFVATNITPMDGLMLKNCLLDPNNR